MLHKITILTLITIAFLGCKNKAEKAITKDALNVATSESNSTKYKANVTESVIQWTGFKPTGTHSGTIQIDSGNLTINKDQIESGTFIIDMTSIKDDDGSERLEGHLKSADFFDVESFASASFSITGYALENKSADFFDVESFASASFSITGYALENGVNTLSGNLKLKDVENNVTFPVTMVKNGTTVTLTSEAFTIDRSKWNVKYGSKSFFDNLGDKFINDEIELKLTIKVSQS